MHVTIEYVILIPILILQIFLFPIVVNDMMSNWVDSRQLIALQENAGQMGSSIQQVYYSLNHTSILDGTLTSKLNVPPYIEGKTYTANATLRTVLSLPSDSSKILDITLRLTGTGVTTTTSVTLGQNVEWADSTFQSNSNNQTCITAQKEDSVIHLSFGLP
jgi:hypothetical protein